MNEIIEEVKEGSVKEILQEQNSYTFTGYNMDVKTVVLNQGIAIFDLNAIGNGEYQNIAIKVSKGDGSYSHGHIFNETGETYFGKTSIRIEEKGTYIINVKINGSWTLKIY